MGSNTPLLDVLAAHLPPTVSSAELSSLPSNTLETILAFVLGADCPPRLPDARHDWSRSQPPVLSALQDALGSRAPKRPRDVPDAEDPTPKRQKTDLTQDADDMPHFTLPSISTTSPVRKKVDVTVHARSIRFVNPSTRALEATVPLPRITRAFLLPTRGKTKGHWTVVLLTTDIPDKGKSATTTPGSGSGSATQQIIFGLDALSPAAFEAMSYGTKTTIITVAKGEETASVLRLFLSYLPVPLFEPSSSAFRSACATPKAGHGAAGIDAYLAAKAGTLWFLDQGILWGESKPCSFWAVGDLVPKEGVRMISATGRTCSVILTRSAPTEGGEEVDEGEEMVETTFSMIDGREQDPIDAWARHRKHLFGKSIAGAGAGPVAGPSSQMVGSSTDVRSTHPVTNGTVQGAAWDDSDSDDDDFEASSEDLEHCSDSDSDGEGEGERSGDENASQHSEGVEESEEEPEEEEEEELDAARHPLLRPGAMPRMSKAAIEAVVDMVHRDLVDDASEEEDELEE